MSQQFNKIFRFIVTCGYIGRLPFAPGTYASILGCVLVYLFPSLFTNLVIVVCLVVCAVLCINQLEFEGQDPGYIVIDELAGMCIAMTGQSVTLINIVIGFAFFRGFDILKPFPIRHAERLPKGYGIVADDVIAGIFANALLTIWVRVKWY